MKSESEALVELIKNPTGEMGLHSMGTDFEDLDTIVKELKSKGTKITLEPVSKSIGLLAFCEDPNGAKIALIQHH